MGVRDRTSHLLLLGVLGLATLDCVGIGAPGGSDAQLQVTHRGVLYGRVLGPAQEPVEYAHVILGSQLPGALAEQGVRADAFYANTDAEGRYRVYFDAGFPDPIPQAWYLELEVEQGLVYYQPDKLKVEWLGQPIDTPLDSLEVDLSVDSIPS